MVFLGRFNPDEDDFEGNTFFAHPQRPDGDYDPEELGGGLAPFRRDDKRYCGFLYLRPNRTGNRALSFGRGSLIDTIVRLESDKAGSLWTSALGALDDIDLAEATPGFAEIRDQMLSRVRKFLSVPDGDTAVGVRPVGPDARAPARGAAHVHRDPAGHLPGAVQPAVNRRAQRAWCSLC